MPRVKKYRFTKRRPVTSAPLSTTTTTTKTTIQGEGTSIPTSTPTMGDPPPTPTTDLPSTPSPAAELHPLLCCVICYNSFPYYPLTCVTWEAEVTKDFYLALNIPEDNAVGGLPFCPECHSKVSIMFSLHQQLQNILQNFNCLRNELAFTVVSSIYLGLGQGQQNCTRSRGPLDLIRQQIFNRWKDLYQEAKRIKSGDVYDPSTTMKYLTPKLSVADEFPTDPSTMNISGDAKQKLTALRKTPASINKLNMNGNKLGKETNKAQVTVTNMGMPKLEPMAKLPLSKLSGGPQQRRGLAFGQSRLGSKGKPTKKHGLLHHKAIGGSKTFKQQSDPKSSKFNLNNHFVPNSAYRKKAPKRLANGLWKCNFCPVTYNNSTCVSQHESRAHPDTRPFLCTMCPKGFLTLDGVRKHLQAVHQDIVEGYVKCPFCPRIFARQIGFQQHVSSVHKGKKAPDFTTLQEASKTKQKKKKAKVALTAAVIVVPRPLASPPSPEITDMKSQPIVKRSPSPERARTSELKTGKPGTGVILGKRSSRGRKSSNLSTPAKEEEKEAQGIPSVNGRISPQVETEIENGNAEKEKESKSGVEVANGNELTEDVKVEKLVEGLKAEMVEVESKQEDVPEGLPAKRRRRTSAAAQPPQAVTLTNRRSSAKHKELLTCPICGKTFIGPWALAGHGKTHKGKRISAPKITKSESKNGDIAAEAEHNAEDDPGDTTPKTLEPSTDALTRTDMTEDFSKVKEDDEMKVPGDGETKGDKHGEEGMAIK